MDNVDIQGNLSDLDFAVDNLGKATLESPVRNCEYHLGQCSFVSDFNKILYLTESNEVQRYVKEGKALPEMERAGARSHIYHDPAWSRAAIVTCGGLCPGLNDVIKGLVQSLWFDYEIKQIYGIRYGYEGFIPKYGHSPMMLNPEIVDSIHEQGGTILGSSRGAQDIGEIVDTLQRMNINMLFTIGGDGTLRGAHDIAQEIEKRGLKISVVGVPKTIDNDLMFTDRTFGFETSVYQTFEVISSAHMEAKGAHRGIGLVKLMGRDSGFIAANAALANSVVNMCLVPEVPFKLDGEDGLIKAIERRFENKDHMVIVVAEGAGQDLFEGIPERRDASGNKLHNDIGEFLRDQINDHFREKGEPVQIKYFDPSYSIRCAPTRGSDAVYCYQLAENAVHAAMAGKTDMVVAHWSQNFVHVPIKMATMTRKKINVFGPLWRGVLGATRQNDYFEGIR